MHASYSADLYMHYAVYVLTCHTMGGTPRHSIAAACNLDTLRLLRALISESLAILGEFWDLL